MQHPLTRNRLAPVVTLGALLAAIPVSASTAKTADQPTWSDDVAPIVYRNCASCHRPEQSAPMSLLSYEEARPWARSIARNVGERVMPPWHATADSAAFANDRSLTDAEVDTIVRWAGAGAPAGDLEHAPKPPDFPESEWRLGEPDHVVTLEQVTVPGGGPDQFHDLIGKLGLDQDRWITAVEILPGNAKVVHHVIVYAVKGFNVDPQGGWLGAWAAGTDPMVFPEGTGRKLAKGSNLIADMHYHPTETEQTDVTRIGLHFADEPPAKELTNVWVANDGFKIPAGATDHEVRTTHTFWQDGKVLTLTPHMHYRGKDFKYTFRYPDGREIVPLRVDDWDFNWQTVYVLDEPIPVTEGTTVEVVAHYDNSANNPDNPDPTKDVTFGLESYDEMMIGFLDYVVDEGVAPKSPFELRTAKIPQLAAKHPGDVYKVSGKEPEKRSEPNSWAPLYLPRSGDGTFFVITNDQLVAAPVTEIEWKGDSFESTVQIQGAPMGLEGTVAADGSIETRLMLPNGNPMTWSGERVEG